MLIATNGVQKANVANASIGKQGEGSSVINQISSIRTTIAGAFEQPTVTSQSTPCCVPDRRHVFVGKASSTMFIFLSMWRRRFAESAVCSTIETAA